VDPLVATALLIAIVVGLVVLEGRRQARRYGPPSGRPNLLGVGLLELQRHLQPDRRVEVLVEQQKGETAAVCEDEHGEGDGNRLRPASGSNDAGHH